MSEWWPQRRFSRHPISLPLLHRPKWPGPARAGVGWTCDLSGGGARVELAERFQPQEFLHVRLQTDRGSIEGEAQMIWAGGSPAADGGILHGLSFTQLAPDQFQLLRGLLLSLKPWQRAGSRLPVELPVTCRVGRRLGSAVQGWTGNISRGGMMLRLPQVLSIGTELDITLHMRLGPLRVSGLIVWLGPPEGVKPGKSVRHGLRFTALDWPTALSLARCMAECP